LAVHESIDLGLAAELNPNEDDEPAVRASASAFGSSSAAVSWSSHGPNIKQCAPSACCT
jgi:hypothetical protein